MNNVHFSQSHFIFILLLLAYFHPSIHTLAVGVDKEIFFTLNGSLEYSEVWQYVMMLLNHKYEKIVLPILLLIINLYIILNAKREERLKYISYTIVTLLFLEFAIALNYYLFSDLMGVKRASPSMILKPFISLTEIFNNPFVKTVSEKSFPGDHAFVLTVWSIITWQYSNRCIKVVIFTIGLFIIPARLVGGAHWFSDVAFSMAFGYLLCSYLIGTSAWNKSTNSLEGFLLKYFKKKPFKNKKVR
jgi:Kdo2-lipid A phosphotransferase